MHQVRNPRDRPHGHAERVDQGAVRLRRRWNRDRVSVVEVVDEAHSHSSSGGGPDCLGYDTGRLGAQVEVVVREIERALRGADEAGDVLGHLQRALTAVGEGAELEHKPHLRGRVFACAWHSITASSRSPTGTARTPSTATSSAPKSSSAMKRSPITSSASGTSTSTGRASRA